MIIEAGASMHDWFGCEFWAGGLGGLHVSNVVMDDARNGAHYVCVVENNELRNIVEGDDQRIIPHQVTGELTDDTSPPNHWLVGLLPVALAADSWP